MHAADLPQMVLPCLLPCACLFSGRLPLLSQTDVESVERFGQEILVGKRLPVHPNLPVFVGYSLARGEEIVWERIGGPDLQSFYTSQRRADDAWRPKEKHALSWSMQLFSALACLHSHG